MKIASFVVLLSLDIYIYIFFSLSTTKRGRFQRSAAGDKKKGIKYLFSNEPVINEPGSSSLSWVYVRFVFQTGKNESACSECAVLLFPPLEAMRASLATLQAKPGSQLCFAPEQRTFPISLEQPHPSVGAEPDFHLPGNANLPHLSHAAFETGESQPCQVLGRLFPARGDFVFSCVWKETSTATFSRPL